MIFSNFYYLEKIICSSLNLDLSNISSGLLLTVKIYFYLINFFIYRNSRILSWFSTLIHIDWVVCRHTLISIYNFYFKITVTIMRFDFTTWKFKKEEITWLYVISIEYSVIILTLLKQRTSNQQLYRIIHCIHVYNGKNISIRNKKMTQYRLMPKFKRLIWILNSSRIGFLAIVFVSFKNIFLKEIVLLTSNLHEILYFFIKPKFCL